MTEHSSVVFWIIERSGAVQVPEAAIIPIPGNGPLPVVERCILIVPDPLSETGELKAQQRDLANWIRSYEPHLPNYAVCVFYTLGIINGILLKEISHGRFIRVGNFTLTWTEMEASMNVAARTVN